MLLLFRGEEGGLYANFNACLKKIANLFTQLNIPLFLSLCVYIVNYAQTGEILNSCLSFSELLLW